MLYSECYEWCYDKFHKIHGKVHVPEPLFNGVKGLKHM